MEPFITLLAINFMAAGYHGSIVWRMAELRAAQLTA